MPCSDGGPTRSEQDADLRRLEAMLCYVTTRWAKGHHWLDVLSENLELRYWWDRHQAEDAFRREREEAGARVKAVRKRAIAKLNPEERAALRLNGDF